MRKRIFLILLAVALFPILGDASGITGGGPGRLLIITGTDPAPGTEILHTVPPGVRWRVVCFRFQFITDATSVDRSVQVLLDDGGEDYFRTIVTSTQFRLENWVFTAASGIPNQSGLSDDQRLALPANLLLPAGHRIRTSTQGLQAGDDFGAPQIFIEEYSE